MSSISKGILAATEGTKVSAEGIKVHLKEFKKQCDLAAALAKCPGVMGAPLQAVRVYHDKVVDAVLAKLRKEYTPTFEIPSAGPSKAEVLEGGRQRKQPGGMGGKEASPTKAVDDDDAVPAGKKPAASRRSGPLLSDDGPTTEHTSVRSSSTPASAAAISPTPLAAAAFDSVSGTPKSTPDRPFSDVCDQLASLDAKLSTKATVMELTTQLDAAKAKAAMFEVKASQLEQEAKTNAAAVAKRIEELTEEARSAAPRRLRSASASSSSCTSSRPLCGTPSWRRRTPTPLRHRSRPSRRHRPRSEQEGEFIFPPPECDVSPGTHMLSWRPK